MEEGTDEVSDIRTFGDSIISLTPVEERVANPALKNKQALKPSAFSVFPPHRLVYSPRIVPFSPSCRLTTTLESNSTSVRALAVQGYGIALTTWCTGGNSLETASSSDIQDFVKTNGGHTVITKVRHPCAPWSGSGLERDTSIWASAVYNAYTD